MKRRAQSSPSSVRATAFFCLFFFISTIYVSQVVISVTAEVEPAPAEPTVEQNLKGVKVGLKTDDEVVEREERAISSEGYSVAEQKQMRERAQKFAFQAEVNRLMHLIINSLYSNKDIFLRELISNASDALDKIRFLGVQDPTQLGDGELAQLNIRIRADPESNTLTITDKGIGMTKEELIANLGTIAKSGTKEFLEAIAKSADTNLIGQFGVGFYSSFLVADKVVVTSKSNKDDTQWVWESNAENEFSITEDPKGNTLGRGTRITLHLKEEAKEYLKQDKLKALVTKYSEFINFPIYLWASHEESEEVPVEDDEEEEKVDLGEKSEEEAEAEEEDKPKTKTVTKTVWGWELLNQTKPLWTRSPKDITEEEYHNFFKSLTKGVEDPLSYTHFSAEGEVEFKALLYIPGTPPGSMFDTSGKPANRIRLYVRRVFISDQFEDFLPRYLSFIEGIVDSDDLPLNVSREILQQDRTLAMIKKKLVRKIIALFQSLQDEPEKYEQFYEKYHQNLKLGVIEDTSNRARLSKLLRFHSSKTATTTTLQEYVDRMKEGQKDIYYLAGESLASLENSPLVERALKSGYEVLYMTDPMDEYTVSHLNRFDNKYPLTNIAKEGIKFDEEESAKEEQKANEQEFKTLTDFLKTALTSKISKAIVSDRLVRAPAALASGAFGFTANMERLMKAQAFVDQKQLEFMKSQRVLEINPKHPLIVELNKRIKENAGDEVNNLLAEVLYETAALQSGFNIDDPTAFASGVHKLLKLSLNIDVNAEAPEEATTSRSTADAESVADERDEL